LINAHLVLLIHFIKYEKCEVRGLCVVSQITKQLIDKRNT